MKKSVFYGVLASLFFAVTFVLNRSMNLGGGSWLWSASLRFLFMLPILWAVLGTRGRAAPVYREIAAAPGKWLLWSTIGFGLFYTPICFASAFGASWFVAGSWQIVIVMGALMTPLFGKPVPVKALCTSGIILLGVCFLQLQHAQESGMQGVLLCIAPILIASLSYPLGNRKMMLVCGGRIDTTQRVFGMTICSLPFWIALSAAALILDGPPSVAQLIQSFLVAVFSGVIGTILFFQATELVKHNAQQLAVAESTQATEVLFTLLGGVLLLGDPLPDLFGVIGLGLIVVGIIAGSLAAK